MLSDAEMKRLDIAIAGFGNENVEVWPRMLRGLVDSLLDVEKTPAVTEYVAQELGVVNIPDILADNGYGGVEVKFVEKKSAWQKFFGK